MTISDENWRKYGDMLKSLNNARLVAILAEARTALVGQSSFDGLADAMNRWADDLHDDKNAVIREYLQEQLKTVQE